MSKQQTFRIVAVYPDVGVPFPGEQTRKLRDQPMNVQRSSYWLRYLGLGVVREVPRELVVRRTSPITPAKGEE